jgi:hypothetical protein
MKKLVMSLAAAAVLLGSAGHAAACGMYIRHRDPDAPSLLAKAARYEARGKAVAALRVYEEVLAQFWTSSGLRAVARFSANRLRERLQEASDAGVQTAHVPSKGDALLASR